MSYDPAVHHPPSPRLRRTSRRSIRLKGHDYAGGGVYFVTICAHREAGNIFAPPDVREMVAREWKNAARAGPVSAQNEEGTHKGCPYVVMPDHFHAVVRISVGAGLVPARSLGDVIGAFKSRVVHEYIAGVQAGLWPRFPGKMWHRNYYEMIVRSEEAERKIVEYIHLNPWRCVQELGGGWHSPKEKEMLEWLLKEGRRVIACPAWGIEDSAFAPGVRNALEENRMLILEMRDISGNLAAAEARNRFVIEHADALFTPHVTRGGMLDRLLKELSKAS
jgi:putative transposase